MTKANTDALRLVPFETIEAQAEAWSDRVEIQRMVEATSAVFAKWASPELLSRFRQQMMGVIQQAYIEGAAEAAPASPLPGGGDWSAIRNAFVRHAEAFVKASRYEEASAIADKAAREIQDLMSALPAAPTGDA